LFNSSCSSSPTSTGSITSKFSYEIDGVPYSNTIQLPASNPTIIQGSCGYTTSDQGLVSIVMGMPKSTDPSMIIYIPSNPRQGSFTITPSSITNNSSYATVSWMPTASLVKMYHSSLGTGNNSNLTVNITSYDPRSGFNNPNYLTNPTNVGLVKGTFSGTLYNNSGQKVTITKGSFEALNIK
jgi:hypothetical protein